MHNRARLIVASFLTKDLDVDWRRGAGHFLDLLADGDVANNSGNWQWVAGTGNDTRPNRVLNPLRQAERFDPDGEYVRRYLPELESVAGGPSPALAARRLRQARLPGADRRPRRGGRGVPGAPSDERSSFVAHWATNDERTHRIGSLSSSAHGRRLASDRAGWFSGRRRADS